MEVNRINRELLLYNAFKPKEIHRSIRGLDHMKFWKGTEFRSFLLYYGMVLLRKYLVEDEYMNFLRLCCATSICYIDAYEPYRELAQKWFDDYIEGCINLYGEYSISSNVHNLTHLVNDVKQCGSLQDISAYQFENLLQTIKLKIKQKNMPLEQVTRRLIELSQNHNTMIRPTEEKKHAQVKYPYSLNGNQVFKEVAFSNFVLSNRKHSDSWFLTNSRDIVFMKYATFIDSENIFIFGTTLKSKINYFFFPISSTHLDIYMSNGEMNTQIEKFELKSIKAKLVCLPNDQVTSVFIPLLHTIK